PVREGRLPTVLPHDELSRSNVLTLLESRDGSLWIGTTRGVARRRGATVQMFGEKEGAPPGAVLAIAEDRDGVLWIGSRLGAWRLDGERFVRFEFPSKAVSAVLTLSADPEEGVWVGAARRLFQFD